MEITSAQRALAPIEHLLRRCVDDAWNDYTEHYGHVRHIHSPRCRAGIMYDHMVHHAHRHLGDVPGVAFHEEKQLFLVRFGDVAFIRFKKFNDFNQASNYPTRQAQMFGQQLELPGIPCLARLTVGYRLDKLATRIETVWVTLPKGARNLWEYEIERPVAEIVDLPQPADRDSGARRDRVRPRQPDVGRDVKDD